MSALELHDANKQIAFNGALAEVEAQCEALHELDKKTEGRKALLIGGMVLGGLGVLAGIVAESVAIGVGGGLGFLVFIVLYFMIADNDIEDRKLDTARTVLDTLRDELHPKRPVELGIDFRSYDSAPDDVWMTLALMLDNGVGVKLDASTHYKRKERKKRKYTKIKDKLHERLAVTYKPPKGKQFDPTAQSRIRAPRLPSLSLRSTKVSPKAATFVFSTSTSVRVSGRGGWDDSTLGELIDGRLAVAAVIGSYRALATAGATGEA